MLNFLYPAYLWFGSSLKLNKEVNNFLKNIYCQNKNQDKFCNICIKCTQIEQKQHSNIRFIQPEGNTYTTADLKIIFSTISFALQKNEHFFFVLYNADSLNATCANSLLKSLEEPPNGYHFILLAQRKDGVLPTIVSRCIVKNFTQEFDQDNRLLSYFIEANINKAQDFSYELETQKPIEQEVLIIVDQLEKYWLNFFKQALLDNNNINIKKAENVINILNKFRKYPPMPGSAKLALKSLYLNLLNF